MFYIICKNYNVREKILSKLKKENIFSTFHYIPLHKSIMGYEYYRGKLSVTESLSKRIIRLPLWIGMDQKMVFKKLKKILDV